jgi:predicted GIY-YIG superfamily endonuclease
LYRVYGEADSLLYIGISKHFGVRWQQHAQNSRGGTSGAG